MKIKSQFLIFLPLLLLAILSSEDIGAQNTVSPYSIFGPGEIQSGGFGTQRGMGGTGIAIASDNHLNNLNPASYAGMDSLKLIFEFGLSAKGYSITNSNQTVSGFEANLSYFALGFKYTPWLAGSFGLVPFTSVGYSINREKYVEGMNETYTSNYEGSGGITRFYYSNAIKLFKKLSLGANVSYMFGPLIQEEHVIPTSIVPEVTIERKDYMRSLYFDFGLQYKFSSPKTDYSFGFTYAPEQNLNSKHIVTAYNSEMTTIEEEETNTDYVVIPQIFGAGVSMSRDRLTLAMDYTYQQWSKVEYPIQVDPFVDAQRFAVGVATNLWEPSPINPGFKNWTYRAGYSYESSYLKFKNNNLTSHEVTFGLGIPIYGAISDLNISLTGGVNGDKNGNLTKEKFLMLDIGFSLNEFAFFKRTID